MKDLGRHRRLAGSILGILLFGAALWAVLDSRAALGRALERSGEASPWLFGLAVVLPLANWALVSLSFWVLMRRHGPIGAGEMHGLVAMSWLLNYLPLRPGMIGRLTYHKVINGIGLKDSVRVMVVLMACTACCGAALGATAIAVDDAPAPLWAAAVAAPGVLFAAGAMAGPGRTRPILLALALRYADMGVWAARYWALFRIVGAPVAVEEAVAIALVAQAVSLVPISGNGLGIREWCVGLLAGVLPSAAEGVDAGLAADVINRAAEVVVSVPLGLIAARHVSRRLSGRGRAPVAARSDR